MTNLKNIAAAVASLVIFSSIANAQVSTGLPEAYNTGYSEPLSVKYLGADANYLTFEVSIAPQFISKSQVKLVDKEEGYLYSFNFTKGKNVTIVKVEKRDKQVLNFDMVANKKVYTKSFSVNTSVEEKISVNAVVHL